MATQNQFNYPMYDFAVGWFNRQPKNPLDFIAPILQAEGKTGTYKHYPQGYAFRVVDTDRALYSEANTINLEADDVPFKLMEKKLRIPVDDEELTLNTGTRQEAADQVALAKSGTLLSTWRTSAIVEGLTIFRAAVPAEQNVGNWSAASSDPIAELKAIIQTFRETNGVTPNRILMSDNAWDILCSNSAVLSAIAYNSAQALTKELFFKLLGFGDDSGEPTPQLMKCTVPVAGAKPGPGVPFVGSNALANDVWITYVDEGEQVGNMCGLRTLNLSGDSPVETVESYYDRPKSTTFYEVKQHRNFVVTAESCVKRLAIS